MTRTAYFAFACLAPLLCGACSTFQQGVEKDPSRQMQAVHTAVPVVIDGKLDDPVWKVAPWYRLGYSKDREAKGEVVKDTGRVRLSWDADYLYLAAEFFDRDVVATRDEDEAHHYETGDVCELFLKPETAEHYWEMYVTPGGRKTTFYLPKFMDIAPRNTYTSGLRVAAQVTGTLNDSSDQDYGWTGEMAVPINDLTAHGNPFGPGEKWRIFIGRYNYNIQHADKKPEHSMTPPLSQTFFHLTKEYPALELVK